MVPFTESDLKKITVPQLKLLCKEKRVVGYSKLPKDGIIAKLLEWQKASRGVSSNLPARAGDRASSILSQRFTAGDSPNSLTNLGDMKPGLIPVGSPVNATHCSQLVEIDSTSNLNSGVVSHNTINFDPLTNRGDVYLKRPRVASGHFEPSSMTTKSDHIQRAMPPSHDDRSIRLDIPTSPVEGRDNDNNKEVKMCHDVFGTTDSIKPAAKRFKALIPKGAGGSVARPSHHMEVYAAAPKTTPNSRLILDVHFLSDHTWQTRYLDFPLVGKLIPLSPISLPPTIFQRKHVSRLSLVLSEISFEDLKACSLVSRAFRYSAYLSAFHQLSRKFSGKRLQEVFGRYPGDIFNFWPYLRLRIGEVGVRKGLYERSYLPGAFKGLFQIDEWLWSSPDHEKQLTIALRFLMTKLYFMVSVNQHDTEFRHSGELGRVVDVQEIVEKEIWKVTYCSQSSTIQTFYVLETTCEVIGESAISNKIMSDQLQINLRMDWAAYIEAVTNKNNADGHIGLSQRLQWTNHEEYEHGISKIWLKKMQAEMGSEKVQIATHYIFACVIGNSISGPWRTANEMAQEFDGRPSMAPEGGGIRKPQVQKLCLFLPAHHHVESVHFTTRYGHALHPALAIVQTPGREYLILKDNGMQVGCEEEGVGFIWMELLGCTSAGCPKV